MAKALTTQANPQNNSAAFTDQSNLTGAGVIIFRPSEPNPQGAVYATFAEAYTNYRQQVDESPNREMQFIFDNSLLAPSTPIIWPAVEGVATQRYNSRTVFMGVMANHWGTNNQVVVHATNDMKAEISLDSESNAYRFQINGLQIVRLAGPSTTPMVKAVGTPAPSSLFLLVCQAGSVKNESSAVMVEWTGAGPAKLESIKWTAESGSIFNATASSSLIVRAQETKYGKNTLSSSATMSVDSQVDVDTAIGGQDGLILSAGKELRGPRASMNIRPSRMLTVLTREQLAVAGNRPVIKQAFGLTYTGQPTAGDTAILWDNTSNWGFTFVAGPPSTPFEVTIGANVRATMVNLADAITAAPASPWTATLFDNPQTDRFGVAVVRNAQVVERYADTAFSTVNTGGVGKLVRFDSAAEGVPLSYSKPTSTVLTGVMSPGAAGFSSIEEPLDGMIVEVLDGLTSGFYRAQVAIGPSGTAEWQLVVVPLEPTLSITGAGTFSVARGTRLVVADLPPATAATFRVLSANGSGYYSDVISVRRKDGNGGSTLTFSPIGATVNGAASETIPVTSGRIYSFDTVNNDWVTVGSA